MRAIGPYELRLMLSDVHGEVNESVDDPDVRDTLNILRHDMKMSPNEIILGLRHDVYHAGGRASFDDFLENQASIPAHALLSNWLDQLGPHEAMDDLRSLVMARRSANVTTEAVTADTISLDELKQMIEDCGSVKKLDQFADLDAVDIAPEPTYDDTAYEDPESYGEQHHGGRNLGNGGKSRMAREQLHHTAEYAVELWNLLDDEDEIPEWCQSKIAVIADAISKVKHHLEYKVEKPKVLKLDGE